MHKAFSYIIYRFDNYLGVVYGIAFILTREHSVVSAELADNLVYYRRLYFVGINIVFLVFQKAVYVETVTPIPVKEIEKESLVKKASDAVKKTVLK